MDTPLNCVKQTSKTIIFESFNPESTNNLYTLLKNEYEDGNTEKFLDEHLNSLQVNTFDEFLNKFAPSVYEMIVPTENGFKMEYSLEKPNGPYKEISITKHSFFNMIQRLYREKGSSGCNNTEFDYTQIREMLTPEYEQKQVKKIRKDLEYNFQKYLEVENNPEKKMEKSKVVKRINTLRKDIVDKYNESPLSLIPLALADVEKKLELVAPDKSTNGVEDVSSKKLLGGSLQYDNNGDLILIPYTENIEENIQNDECDSNKLIGLIENDFDKKANEGINNNFMRNLVVSNYVANNSLIVENIQELEIKKENYQKIYKQSQESFINAISTIVQKLIGVQAFFEHASLNSKLQTSMIVANCEVSEILEVKEKLKKMLKDLNNTPETKVWFAILPGLTLSNETYVEDLEHEESLDDFDLDDFDLDSDNNSSKIPFKASMQESKPLLDLLEEVKIMTFFNVYANENSGFMNLTKDRIEEYKKVADRNSEYSVFCYPNFTILPQEKTYVSIGEDLNNEKVYLKIPGIYLDSSYVACGIVAGYQQPAILKEKGFKSVNKDYPGVRFDIEKLDNNKIFKTSLNRERQINWGEDVENVINEDLFGFCFSSNLIYHEGRPMTNSYVYLARTMKKNENGYFTPIYRTLTREFINQYIRLRTLTDSEIKKFISTDKRAWIRYRDDNPTCVNNLLALNEDIEYKDKKISIKFEKAEEIIDIEVIAE